MATATATAGTNMSSFTESITAAATAICRYDRRWAARISHASAVLLPTTEGHGGSIKTIEAMSSGAPLIATQHAFRGMRLDPASLGAVTLAADAPAFAAAMRRAAESQANPASRAEADTRKLYERHFAFEAYRAALARLALPLLRPDPN